MTCNLSNFTVQSIRVHEILHHTSSDFVKIKNLLIPGDRKYKLPNLNPLEILELKVNQGTQQVGLQITIKNAKIYGVKDTVIDDIEYV